MSPLRRPAPAESATAGKLDDLEFDLPHLVPLEMVEAER
jgi:hypothetical protein